MINSKKDQLESNRVLRKLIKKWSNTQETRLKADLLLGKNPKLKQGMSNGRRKG